MLQLIVIKKMDLSNKPKYLICPDCKNQSIKLNINEFCSVVKNKPGGKFYLYWYTDCLLFSPVPEEMVGVLSHKYSIMAKGPETNWKMESKKSRRRVFAVAEINGRQVGITFPGFFEKVFRVAMGLGMPIDFQDKRLDTEDYGFPKPDLDAMFGFRFGQEQLLRKFLSAGRSGLLGAPTRYGKTTLMVNTARAFPDSNIVVAAPGVDLVLQLHDDFTGSRGIKGREIKVICSGKRTKYQSQESNGITIVSSDSLDKCDPGQVDILIADEPHSTVTASRIHKFNMFNKARRFGFGATLEGRYDGADMLIEGLFGPVLAERTYLEAVAEGAICPLHILFLEVELTPSFYSDRTDAYNDLLFENETMAQLIRDMCEDIIPLDWQTLIFIEHERQADLYLGQIGEEHTIAMAKRMTSKKQRKEITDKMRDDKIKRCLCTDIYVQGVTFPDVRVLINAAGGGDNTSAIQKPGRLAQVRPGKKCGIVIDFMFKKPENCTAALVEEDPWLFLCIDSLNRMKAYKNKGYAIDVVKSFDELKTIFNKIS